MGRNRPHSDTTECITRSDGAQNSQIDVLFEVPYYPSRRQMLPKLRAFIDHVKSRSDITNRLRVHVNDSRTRPRKRG
jgi:hypothetical protein